jgi:hypothetical protein
LHQLHQALAHAPLLGQLLLGLLLLLLWRLLWTLLGLLHLLQCQLQNSIAQAPTLEHKLPDWVNCPAGSRWVVLLYHQLGTGLVLLHHQLADTHSCAADGRQHLRWHQHSTAWGRSAAAAFTAVVGVAGGG